MEGRAKHPFFCFNSVICNCSYKLNLFWLFYLLYFSFLLIVRKNPELYEQLATGQSPKVKPINDHLHTKSMNLIFEYIYQLQNINAVLGICLLRLPSMPFTHSEFPAWGGFYGPKHCKHGSTIWHGNTTTKLIIISILHFIHLILLLYISFI